MDSKQIYKGVELVTRARQSGTAYVADLDLRDLSNGIVFRRWWPVPAQDRAAAFSDTRAAEAHALRFGRDFLDQT